MSFLCNLTNGSLLGCSAIGGLKTIYIGEYVDGVIVGVDSYDTITGITTTGLTVYQFQQDIEHGGLNQVLQASRENGSVFFETTLSFKLIELTDKRRQNLVELSRAPLFAIVESNSGQFYYCGLESSGRSSAGTASLGVALGDLNGVTMDIMWKSAFGISLMDSNLLGTAITINPSV